MPRREAEAALRVPVAVVALLPARRESRYFLRRGVVVSASASSVSGTEALMALRLAVLAVPTVSMVPVVVTAGGERCRIILRGLLCSRVRLCGCCPSSSSSSPLSNDAEESSRADAGCDSNLGAADNATRFLRLRVRKRRRIVFSSFESWWCLLSRLERSEAAAGMMSCAIRAVLYMFSL